MSSGMTSSNSRTAQIVATASAGFHGNMGKQQQRQGSPTRSALSHWIYWPTLGHQLSSARHLGDSSASFNEGFQSSRESSEAPGDIAGKCATTGLEARAQPQTSF